MARLVALDLPGGPDLVRAVADTWEKGDAVFPVDQRLPTAERAKVLENVRPTHVLSDGGLRQAYRGVPVETGDALVIATSGTSGSPKAVVLTMSAVEAAAAMTSLAIGVAGGDRWLLCLPAAHIGGFGVVARSLLTETPLEALSGFDAALVTKAGLEGATLVSLVPAVLGRFDPTIFRLILLGGSAIPTDRPPNTVATYGLTETAGGVVYNGVPLPEVEVRIDQAGQILLRTPTSLRGYRDGTDPHDADGFLPTGDAGHFEDGLLTVEGRLDDLIITGGQKVWPERIEAVLMTHPAVAAVRVIGTPDPEWGHLVTVQIVSGGVAPDLDELRGLVKDTLPAYMAPRRMELVDAADIMSSGKIRRI